MAVHQQCGGKVMLTKPKPDKKQRASWHLSKEANSRQKKHKVEREVPDFDLRYVCAAF